MKKTSIHLLLAASALLSGCATNNTLYGWGSYEPQVYEYFKGESPEQQILVLESHLKETESKGEKIPPGFHAHLGLLYAKVGKDADFQAMLAQEKRLYPESSTYINNLNNKFKK